MNKVEIIKELWRDLSKSNVEQAQKALSKSGWTERRFSVDINENVFHAHLHVVKGNLRFYLFFSNDKLKSISED